MNMIRSALAASVLMVVVNQASAAGFEKSVFWDAHYGALGGAAQSIVTGPQSLYWNPAGLAGSQGLQINGDFSPTWAMYSGPMALNSNTVQNSNTTFSPVGAGFISYGLTPQLGVGAGYYVSAGTRADYDSVTPGSLSALGVTYAPPLKADLTLTELSFGAGYELAPGLKIGAGYRLLFVAAGLDTAGTVGAGAATTLVATQISQASGVAGGFRVGLEYAPKDAAWGLGVSYRNQVRFAVNGMANVTTAGAATPGGTSAGTNETIILSGVLPQRVDAAGHYQFSPSFLALVGYTFTNYSQEKSIGISGLSASTLGGGLPSSSTDVPLNWNNMHNVRVGGEFDGIVDTPLRAGFVWTSQVTPTGNALPILPSPGTGYTVIAGAGHKFSPSFTLDGAFEYSWDSGSVSSANNPASLTGTGNYSASALVMHLSGTYIF